jgi:hypothetical protein
MLGPALVEVNPAKTATPRPVRMTLSGHYHLIRNGQTALMSGISSPSEQQIRAAFASRPGNGSPRQSLSRRPGTPPHAELAPGRDRDESGNSPHSSSPPPAPSPTSASGCDGSPNPSPRPAGRARWIPEPIRGNRVWIPELIGAVSGPGAMDPRTHPGIGSDAMDLPHPRPARGWRTVATRGDLSSRGHRRDALRHRHPT